MIAAAGCQPPVPERPLETTRLTAGGYRLPIEVEELSGLRAGPFVRLGDSSLLTVDRNRCYLSHDDGRSWTEGAWVADTARYLVSSRAVVRTRQGVIILSFSNERERAHWSWDKKTHDSPDARLPTYAVRSVDGGKTWEEPQKMHDDWTGANMDMIETKEGHVVFTSMIMRHHPGHHTVLTYTSADQGRSWQASNIIDLGGTGNHAGVMESILVQLTDGRLWMLMRTNWGNFWQAFSGDQGLTWTEIGPTAIDASSSPGCLRRLSDGHLVLVWNRLFPTGTREYPLRRGDGNFSELPTNWHRGELSMMFSDDDGISWSQPVVIAKAEKKGAQLAYPYVYEARPGLLWITTGSLKIAVREEDFFKISVD